MIIVDPAMGPRVLPPITTEFPGIPIVTPFTVTVGEDGFPPGFAFPIGSLVCAGFPDLSGLTGAPGDIGPKGVSCD